MHTYKVQTGKAEETALKLRHRQEDNTETYLNDGVEWIHLAQDKAMSGCCEQGYEPSGSIQFGGIC